MEERTLLSTFLVSNSDDDGPGSLRQAILDSNAATDATNTIDFDISGDGVQSIFPLSPLPAITAPVVIDGESQPGYADMPLIAIDGSQLGQGDGQTAINGLSITRGNVTVRGLDVVNFIGGAAIDLAGAGTVRDWIYDNFLGTDPTGTQSFPNGYGIVIEGGAVGNLIGTNGDGVDDTDERNVISGNLYGGVLITGVGTMGNTVAGNLIGTSVTGDTGLSDSYSGGYFYLQQGVVISNGASSNWIGISPLNGPALQDQGNVVSGNDTSIRIGYGSDRNVVAGNHIGTDVTGSIAVPNGSGIFIDGASSDNTIGGSSVAAGNLIANNRGAGVVVRSGVSDACIGNEITSNRIFDNDGQAIDLRDDGVTSESVALRYGPNQLQNFPVVIPTGPDRFLGWLGACLPDSSFLVQFFASSAYSGNGSGEAEEYLGSMQVETNSSGQAVFVVPYSAPIDKPIITATATDAWGNTSEITARRTAAMDVPQASLRVNPGRPLVYSSSAGGALAIQDPNAGPLDPDWSLTLSVSAGTLSLSSTLGLSGSGDGTGSLSYTGPLSVMDAALDGLTYTPPPGPHVFASLSSRAESSGASPLEAHWLITDGIFEVDTAADEGPGSLRQAILDADTVTNGPVAIEFHIPGGGVQVIRPATPLPAITTSMRLDGTTQPGYAGTPLVAFGGDAAISASPLSISGGSVTIRGLAVGRVAIHPDASERLVSFVDSPIPPTSIQLVDSREDLLVRSDAISSPNRLASIDEILAPGAYSLAINSPGSPGMYAVSVMLIPANDPDEPIGVGASPVALASGDFNGDGHPDLATVNFSSGDVSILLGNGDGTFQPAIDDPVGTGPSRLIAGDFTGDGHVDLIVGDEDGVQILEGNGEGTFRSARTIAASAGGPLTAGDFDGDGHVDIAVADPIQSDPASAGGSWQVIVLLSHGDGTFRVQRTSFREGQAPSTIVAGDFTGDGHLDLAVADTSTDEVSILIGSGDGSFRSAPHPAGVTSLSSIVAGDFNGDGRLDIAAEAADALTVLFVSNDGALGASVPYAIAFRPAGITARDFDGDGRFDLAVTESDSFTVYILLSDGDSGFRLGEEYRAGVFPSVVLAGDFNGDGRLDLAVGDQGVTFPDSSVSVLLGNGDGSFQSRAANLVGGASLGLAVGDFDRDGRPDFAVTDGLSNEVTVFMGNDDGTFRLARRYATGQVPVTIVTGDFNGDGRLDLAIAERGADAVSILLGNGDGTFRPSGRYSVGGPPIDLVADDFDGDQRLDLAVADADSNEVSVLLGYGNGTFQPARNSAVGRFAYLLASQDFDGDGRRDLAVACLNDDFLSGPVVVMLGQGNGTFQPPVESFEGPYLAAIVATDFDGDGTVDLAAAESFLSADPFGGTTGGLYILLSKGGGAFQPAVRHSTGSELVASMIEGDFDADGRPDLAMGYIESSGPSDYMGFLTGGVAVLVNDGYGTFRPPVYHPFKDEEAVRLGAGDFNNDGYLDVAYTDDLSLTASVVLGLGDGTFAGPGQFTSTSDSDPLVSDLDGDHADDVLIVDGAGDVLYRQGIPGQPGSFRSPVIINTGSPSRDIAWVPRSLDGPLLASVDAHPDPSRVYGISLYAWRNGGFVRVGRLATGRLPAQIIAADLNGTGYDDLVIRNAADGTLTVYFNNGPGSFWTGFNRPFLPAVTIPVGSGVSDVEAIGTNNDGHLDLVVTNKLTAQVGVLYNKGDRTFATLLPYRAGTGLSAINPGAEPEVSSLEATAGVVGGRLVPGGPTGLVTINPGSNRMDVLAGLGGGRFGNPVTILTPSPARLIRMDDFNGDRILDLAVLSDAGVSVYLGDGKGGFSNPQTYNVGSNPTGLTIADLRGTGHPDLLIGDAYGDVLILVGNGDGTFRTFQPVKAAVALAVADLTRNGSLDFVFANQSLDRVTVVYGSAGQTANGSRVIGNEATGVLAPGAVLLDDLNSDGIPDLIVANSGGNNVLVYPGLGNGQFGPPIGGTRGFPVGTDPTGLAVANLNGQPDLVVADSGSNDVSILLGQGKGSSWTMTSGPRIKTGAEPVAVAVGNLLGGTQTDLAVANRGANNVQIFPGVGGGFFNDQPQATRTFAVGQGPSSLFLGHFNGLGQGLATLNTGSNDGTLISLIGTPNPVIQSFPTGGSGPTAGFAGDFTRDGFTDLVVGNNADGHLTLLLGGTGGLSLSQTLVSAEVPNPTGLGFAGVSDGLLSFYVSTAGREAAMHLTFDLEGGAALAAAGSVAATVPIGGLSPEGAQSYATSGSVQQISQLLSFSGSTLDLAVTVLTVSVMPGDLESQTGAAEGIVASVGTTGFGQPVGQPGTEDVSSGSGEPSKDVESKPSVQVEWLPGWERVSIGLDRAWERARAAIRELETVTPDQAPSADGPPPGPAQPAPTPPHPETGNEGRPTGAGVIRVPAGEPTIAAIDAALVEWQTRRPGEEHRVEPIPWGRGRRSAGDGLRFARAMVMITAWTAAGTAWGWRAGPRLSRLKLPAVLAARGVSPVRRSRTEIKSTPAMAHRPAGVR